MHRIQGFRAGVGVFAVSDGLTLPLLRTGGAAAAARGTSPAVKTVAVGDNFRSIRQLPDIADAVPQVETGIAAAMLAEGVSVRFRGRRVIRFNRATVFFQHPIQAVVKCLKFHDAIVLTHAQPVPVERVRHDVARCELPGV